jgi:hypothetical protein
MRFIENSGAAFAPAATFVEVAQCALGIINSLERMRSSAPQPLALLEQLA